MFAAGVICYFSEPLLLLAEYLGSTEESELRLVSDAGVEDHEMLHFHLKLRASSDSLC